MQGDDIRRDRVAGLPDAALWRHSRMVEVTPDDAERCLDLAGFADGCLDPDEHERVAEGLAGDPVAAGGVVAARALASGAEPMAAMPEPAIARARALAGGGEAQPGTRIPFPLNRWHRPP